MIAYSSTNDSGTRSTGTTTSSTTYYRNDVTGGEDAKVEMPAEIWLYFSPYQYTPVVDDFVSHRFVMPEIGYPIVKRSQRREPPRHCLSVSGFV